MDDAIEWRLLFVEENPAELAEAVKALQQVLAAQSLAAVGVATPNGAGVMRELKVLLGAKDVSQLIKALVAFTRDRPLRVGVGARCIDLSKQHDPLMLGQMLKGLIAPEASDTSRTDAARERAAPASGRGWRWWRPRREGDASSRDMGQDSPKSGFLRRAWMKLVAGASDVALLSLTVAIVAVAGQHAAKHAETTSGGWRLPVFLILLPFCLSYTSLLSARARLNRPRFELAHPPGNYQPKEQRILLSVQKSWSYERLRFRSALGKAGTHAQIFGLITTMTLALAFIICFPLSATPPAEGQSMLSLVAVSTAAAAAVSFAISFARIVMRLASQDFNARMYSWATRSLLLSMCATVVAAVLMANKGSSREALVQWYDRALLLGATVAALGGQVLEFIVGKTASLFGLAVQSPPRISDQNEIEGLTPEDIARLAEEGVESTHALAYVPTARLFFATNHSLQRLVDWQDQALLIQWVGVLRAKALKDRLLVRGAIDLWGTVNDLRANEEALKREGGAGPTTKDPRRVSLAQALGMDDAQVTSMLKTVADDQVVRRLHAHYVSTAWINMGSEPAAILNVSLLQGVDAEGLARIVATALLQRPGLTAEDEARVRTVVEQAFQSVAASRPGLFTRPEFGQVVTECLQEALSKQPSPAPLDLEELARLLREMAQKTPAGPSPEKT